MKTRLLITSGIFLAALAAASIPAHAKTMKECAAQWKEMKAANQTGGKSWRDFSKECMAADAGAPNTPPGADKPKSGREAMIARERACAADWKADKKAGKIPAGMKWPQYWSECNKRKKAEGM